MSYERTMTEAEEAEWVAAMKQGGQRAYEIANGDQAPAYAKGGSYDPSLVAKSRKSQSPSVPDPKAPLASVVDALMAMRR